MKYFRSHAPSDSNTFIYCRFFNATSVRYPRIGAKHQSCVENEISSWAIAATRSPNERSWKRAKDTHTNSTNGGATRTHRARRLGAFWINKSSHDDDTAFASIQICLWFIHGFGLRHTHLATIGSWVRTQFYDLIRYITCRFVNQYRYCSLDFRLPKNTANMHFDCRAFAK